jgi:hypothetical protein
MVVNECKRPDSGCCGGDGEQIQRVEFVAAGDLRQHGKAHAYDELP